MDSWLLLSVITRNLRRLGMYSTLVITLSNNQEMPREIMCVVVLDIKSILEYKSPIRKRPVLGSNLYQLGRS